MAAWSAAFRSSGSMAKLTRKGQPRSARTVDIRRSSVPADDREHQLLRRVLKAARANCTIGRGSSFGGVAVAAASPAEGGADARQPVDDDALDLIGQTRRRGRTPRRLDGRRDGRRRGRRRSASASGRFSTFGVVGGLRARRHQCHRQAASAGLLLGGQRRQRRRIGLGRRCFGPVRPAAPPVRRDHRTVAQRLYPAPCAVGCGPGPRCSRATLSATTTRLPEPQPQPGPPRPRAGPAPAGARVVPCATDGAGAVCRLIRRGGGRRAVVLSVLRAGCRAGHFPGAAQGPHRPTTGAVGNHLPARGFCHPFRHGLCHLGRRRARRRRFPTPATPVTSLQPNGAAQNDT